MYKPTPKNYRLLPGVCAMALLLFAAAGWAADQGSLGATSSATAKITLRILPRAESAADYLSSVTQASQGHRALQAYCAGDRAFNRPEGLFQAGLADAADSAELEQALRSRCQGGAELSLPARQSAQDQLTVLIAPV